MVMWAPLDFGCLVMPDEQQVPLGLRSPGASESRATQSNLPCKPDRFSYPFLVQRKRCWFVRDNFKDASTACSTGLALTK